MKAILSMAVLAGVAATTPVWAGEGAGDPFPPNNPPVSVTMTMQRGGNTDPFRWSSAPTNSQMSMQRGGNTDPFRWSAAPIPPAATQRVGGSGKAQNPG